MIHGNVKYKPFARGADNPTAVLTQAIVDGIRARYAKGGITQRELGAQYGIQQSHVSLILNNKIWSTEPAKYQTLRISSSFEFTMQCNHCNAKATWSYYYENSVASIVLRCKGCSQSVTVVLNKENMIDSSNDNESRW